MLKAIVVTYNSCSLYYFLSHALCFGLREDVKKHKNYVITELLLLTGGV